MSRPLPEETLKAHVAATIRLGKRLKELRAASRNAETALLGVTTRKCSECTASWTKHERAARWHVRCTFDDCPSGGSRRHVSDGRVEDGRGSWGPMAITPFPISAHRTGGPDFRSPALRLASPQGTRRGSEWQAFEAQQTEFPIDSVVREPAGAAPCHFVPSCEEVAHALVGIAVNTAEC